MKNKSSNEVDLLKQKLDAIRGQPFPTHILTTVFSLEKAEMLVALSKIKAAFDLCGWRRFNFDAELKLLHKEKFGHYPDFKPPRLTEREQQLFFWKIQAEQDQIVLRLILLGKFSEESQAFQDRWAMAWFYFDAEDSLELQCFEFDGANFAEFDASALYYAYLERRRNDE